MINAGPFVFVVDDDDSVRRSLGRLLKAAGFNVKTFDSAENFLDSYRNDVMACLVLDVRMPKMSGLDLQKRLGESGFKIPIIFMTAHEDARSRDQAMNAGAIAFLRKPFDEQVLLDGDHVGSTPIIINDLRPGKHKVEIKAEGYEDWDKSIDIGPDKEVSLKLQMNRNKMKMHECC